ncbi:hypothetical protein BH18THE2_BH18THE2_21390 [soil metagenome]
MISKFQYSSSSVVKHPFTKWFTFIPLWIAGKDQPNDNTNLKLPLNFILLSMAMNNKWYDPIPTLSRVFELLHIISRKYLA